MGIFEYITEEITEKGKLTTIAYHTYLQRNKNIRKYNNNNNKNNNNNNNNNNHNNNNNNNSDDDTTYKL